MRTSSNSGIAQVEEKSMLDTEMLIGSKFVAGTEAPEP